MLSLAIGNDRGEVLGFSFITFLAPGLIAMQVIQQAFSHSSSSIMIGKIQGNIVDIFPSGSELPARADFFGDEIENIRQFSPSNQRSLEFVESLVLYPTREFNLDEESISKFRSR